MSDQDTAAVLNRIALEACLVPPDGGSPSSETLDAAAAIATAILAAIRAGQVPGVEAGGKPKVLLYFEANDACCEIRGKHKSQEDLLKAQAVVGTAYLVDEITGEEWGDDWNDAPMCCNAGPPYQDRCRGLVSVDVRLGRPLPAPPEGAPVTIHHPTERKATISGAEHHTARIDLTEPPEGA